MGLFSKKKNEAPKGKKAYEQGYVSFTPEDLKESAANTPANDEAYGFLDAAMFTSSHIKTKDKERGVVDIDDVYPITLEETLEMESLLDKADAAVKDRNDNFYHERSGELRGIVEWSKKRHWNFSWLLILGVFISMFFFMSNADSDEKQLQRAEAELEAIEGWTEMDTTLSLSDHKDAPSNDLYNVRSKNANNYKAYELGQLANQYHNDLKSQANYIQRADTATTDDRRESYLASAKESEKAAEEKKAKFEELNKMKFDEIKEMAVEEQEEYVDAMSSSSTFSTILKWFFILLIPVYIFADRPYGYTMSRHRTEAKVLGGLRKVGMWLSAGLFGAGASIGFVDVVTKWSDGSTTREDDGTGPARLAIKIGLFIAAVIVFCATSCIIVIYTTIVGLIRNYDWKAIYANIRGKIDAAKAPKQA